MIGLIKFIDRCYYYEFKDLSMIYLSNVLKFINNENSKYDLINDKNEGSFGTMMIKNPFFVSCFTKIEGKNFSNNKFNKGLAGKLLESERAAGKHRPFIIVSNNKLIELLHELKNSNFVKVTDDNNHILNNNIFTRSVRYSDFNFSKKSKLVNVMIKGLPMDYYLLECLYGLACVNKDNKYKYQQEYRIGSLSNNRAIHKNDPDGIYLKLKYPIKGFSSKLYNPKNLYNLKISDFK